MSDLLFISSSFFSSFAEIDEKPIRVQGLMPEGEGRKEERPMNGPREINTGIISFPLVGSPLGNAEKEAMAGAIIRAAQKKGGWEKIYARDLPEFLGGISVYQLFPQSCWNAFHEMIREGFLIRAKDNRGEYVEVTEKLIDLLSTPRAT